MMPIFENLKFSKKIVRTINVPQARTKKIKYVKHHFQTLILNYHNFFKNYFITINGQPSEKGKNHPSNHIHNSNMIHVEIWRV